MIIFVSDFMNHHQFPLSQELDRITDGNYRFIELTPMPNSFSDAGYQRNFNIPYLFQSWESEKAKKEASELILNADIVIFDQIDSYKHLIKRLSNGKLTFLCGERWLKKGLINLLSPRLIKSQILYHSLFYNKPLYNLCSSAYAASDYKLMHSFKNKCFKWGYFTEVPPESELSGFDKKKTNGKARFISIGRLIDWKRHDLTIKASKLLLDKGLDFEIDIYGSGDQKDNLQSLIKSYNLENQIFLKGNLKNRELTKKLSQYQALIFPSNRREGWGAVVNEAMSHSCPVIGSNMAGSVPYLIEDNVNGLIFSSGNYEQLAKKMELIILSDDLQNTLARNAYNTIKDIWSPKNAAENLLKLIDAINNKGPYPLSGPCSKA